MSALDEIKLYVFHHHHYLDVPEDHESYRNSMIDYSNAHFDPVRGKEFYDRHLRTLVRADELGLRRHRDQRAPQHGLQHDARP